MKKKSLATMQAAAQLVRNTLLSRQAWLKTLLDPRRDIDAECGHPQTLNIEDFAQAFSRQDVAARVVSLWPEETWCEDPEIYETEDATETEFEKEWKKLTTDLPIFSYLQRADVLSGIGRYGVLLLGFDDGGELDTPLEGVTPSGDLPESQGRKRKLLYLRPLDETVVNIQAFENDPTNPRYGLPTRYQIKFADAETGILPAGDGSGSTVTVVTRTVHWTRLIHLADNRRNSEVLGTPRMEKVMNRLLDLKKVSGGSGEMFWKGGFPGFSLETQSVGPGEEIATIDQEATAEQMEAYMNGLQRYIATEGLSVKGLTVQIADPRPHVEIQLKLISVAMGVPWRVLVGSEAAQLASEQDTRAWNRRINRRRKEYVDPFILRPFVHRLISAGVLPLPPQGVQIAWTDLNSPSEEDRATVAEKRTNAMAKYVQAGADTLMAPFHFLTLVLGLTDEEAESIIEDAGDRIDEIGEGNEPGLETPPTPDQIEEGELRREGMRRELTQPPPNAARRNGGQ